MLTIRQNKLLTLSYYIRKVTSSHVQVALQPHELKKLNLVAPEKSDDFSYAIRKVASPLRRLQSNRANIGNFVFLYT